MAANRRSQVKTSSDSDDFYLPPAPTIAATDVLRVANKIPSFDGYDKSYRPRFPFLELNYEDRASSGSPRDIAKRFFETLSLDDDAISALLLSN
jgi:hypothetical protein